MNETARSPAPEGSFASQVLEWQADRFACEHTLSTYLGNEATFEAIHPELAASWTWRVRLIASSIGLAICLFDNARMVRREGFSHPHPAMRMCLALGGILELTTNWYFEALEWNHELSEFIWSDPEPRDQELGDGYKLIGGTVWDIYSTLEVIRGKSDAGQDELRNFLNADHDANTLALALAWWFGGNVEFNSDKLQPSSKNQRRTLKNFLAVVSRARGVAIQEVEKSWSRAANLCNDMQGFVAASNSTVEELRELARCCVVKSVAYEPWAKMDGPNAIYVETLRNLSASRVK